MVFIGTDTYDANGNISFEDIKTTAQQSLSARIQKSGTLDGDTVLTHLGFDHGDRDITLRGSITAAQQATILNMLENHSAFTLSNDEGFFTGAIQAVQMDNGELTLTFMVNDKIV